MVAAVSPVAGLRRANARARLAAIAGNPMMLYEGAGRGNRMANWRTTALGPRAEIVPTAQLLRDRARDLVRNNPYAEKGLRALVANVVGTGLMPKIEAPQKRLQAALDDAAVRWMDTVKCDADGLSDLYGLQALAFRATVESGESFIRRRPRTAGFARKHGVPLQIQALEAEYLDRAKNTQRDRSSQTFIVDGIEYDRFGRRLAYWLFDSHPLDSNAFLAPASVRVPAEDVIHLFRVDRPGQQGGVSWFSPAIVRFRDFADYQDAQLVRQKIAACFAVFEINADVTSPAYIDAEQAEESNLETLTPGIYEKLPPGRDIKFASPPNADDQGYVADQLRAISAGLGVTYEALTNDYGNVNFSSGRMGWLEFQRSISQYQSHLIIPRLCSPIAQWFLEGFELASGMSIDKARISWTPPRREMIEPAREVPAQETMVQMGTASLSELIRQSGRDPEVVFNEIASERRFLRELGIEPKRDAAPPAPAAEQQEEEPANG